MLKRAKPALEILVADRGAQTGLNAGPAFLVAHSHRLALTQLDGTGDRRGDKASGIVRKGRC